MKIKGKVLRAFNEKNGKQYKPKDEYNEADIYIAEQPRYQELYYKGFVEKGEKVETIKKEEN